MAITTTWSVGNLTRIDADGGVIQAVWNLVAMEPRLNSCPLEAIIV